MRPFEGLSISTVRELNSYEQAGGVQRGRALDDLVIQHLTTVRELESLGLFESELIRCLAEGFNIKELAQLFGVCPATIVRRIYEITPALYGVDAYDCLMKAASA